MRTSRGFTTIELLIAVAILAVLAVLAVPSFRDYIDKSHVRGAAEAIYEQLQYARSQSLKRSVPIVVDFSANNTTTWALGITDDSECWALTNPTSCTTWGCDAKDTTTDPCVIEYDNDPAVDFDSDGSGNDPVLMRLEGKDFSSVTMKGSTGNTPSFGNLDGPGTCSTKDTKEACFEPTRGLAKIKSTAPEEHIEVSKGGYTLQVRVDESGQVNICVPTGYFAGYEACPP